MARDPEAMVAGREERGPPFRRESEFLRHPRL